MNYVQIFLHYLKTEKELKKTKLKKTSLLKTLKKLLKIFHFNLTDSQIRVLSEINKDLSDSKRMFRIIQGDVGSGKTIVSLLAISNVIESNYQCALMAPTEILAKQHFNLAKKIFKPLDYKIDFLSGKTEIKKRKIYFTFYSSGKNKFNSGYSFTFSKKNF